jgi:hypothetical protein
MIDWLIHARKLRWDIYIIIQHVNALDKQIREMFGEFVVNCIRLDRIKIPFLTWATNLIGFNVRLPKIHRAIVKYGSGQVSFSVDVWTYMGKSLYPAFNTEQGFNTGEVEATYQHLSPWLLVGRYPKKRNPIDFRLIGKYALYSFLSLAIGLVGFGFYSSREVDASSVVVSVPQKKGVSYVQTIPEASVFDSVVIAGSFHFDDGRFDYLFEKDGKQWLPTNVLVSASGPCVAYLRLTRIDKPEKVVCKEWETTPDAQRHTAAAPTTPNAAGVASASPVPLVATLSDSAKPDEVGSQSSAEAQPVAVLSPP